MQHIHQGLPKTTMFDAKAFRTVAVCLDSGKQATNACYNDLRGINRVAYVNVYPGDEPDGFCDKHVQVEYCNEGGGVATPYCPGSGVASLVKLTDGEIASIRSARGVGLSAEHCIDNYVYREAGGWYGFHGNLHNPEGLPYKPCQVHTAAPEPEVPEDFFEDW